VFIRATTIELSGDTYAKNTEFPSLSTHHETKQDVQGDNSGRRAIP
jgi:hypothetical protein